MFRASNRFFSQRATHCAGAGGLFLSLQSELNSAGSRCKFERALTLLKGTTDSAKNKLTLHPAEVVELRCMATVYRHDMPELANSKRAFSQYLNAYLRQIHSSNANHFSP